MSQPTNLIFIIYHQPVNYHTLSLSICFYYHTTLPPAPQVLSQLQRSMPSGRKLACKSNSISTILTGSFTATYKHQAHQRHSDCKIPRLFSCCNLRRTFVQPALDRKDDGSPPDHPSFLLATADQGETGGILVAREHCRHRERGAEGFC